METPHVCSLDEIKASQEKLLALENAEQKISGLKSLPVRMALDRHGYSIWYEDGGDACPIALADADLATASMLYRSRSFGSEIGQTIMDGIENQYNQHETCKQKFNQIPKNGGEICIYSPISNKYRCFYNKGDKWEYDGRKNDKQNDLIDGSLMGVFPYIIGTTFLTGVFGIAGLAVGAGITAWQCGLFYRAKSDEPFEDMVKTDDVPDLFLGCGCGEKTFFGYSSDTPTPRYIVRKVKKRGLK